MAIKFTSTPDRPVEPKVGKAPKKKDKKVANNNPELDLKAGASSPE
ncbi:hypothetical protein [Brucella pecoris]|uniref:Uncharacterized protein n=1 Tax=Brucella pecoris TaxID=867683 RepID=A0AB34YWW4_9HYPH|nr:hypothetical protein [Brucella pecoris]MBB4095295.1 hypothetical protein [Brucella pecoris]